MIIYTRYITVKVVRLKTRELSLIITRYITVKVVQLKRVEFDNLHSLYNCKGGTAEDKGAELVITKDLYLSKYGAGYFGEQVSIF